MFDWFHNRVPYTDFQQKNLDWLTETVREGEAAVEAKIEEADTAIENAEDATTAANNAKDAANTAAGSANDAATAANNAKDAANTAAANAQAAADKWATPYASTTVAGMTDHAKVYVYTGTEVGYTAGHWYYWDGDSWEDGGVYVGDITDAVLFNSAQSKTAAEKQQAQDNLGMSNVAMNTQFLMDAVGAGTTNLITGITQGYYANGGGFVNNANYSHTNEISVTPGGYIYVAGNLHTYDITQFTSVGVFLDESDDYLTSIYVEVGAVDPPWIITIPENAAKLIINTDYAASGYTDHLPNGLVCLTLNSGSIDLVNLRELSDGSKKLKIVAGVVRNAGSGWEYINDSYHNPLNLSTVSVDSSGRLVINYGFTAEKVLSLVVCPDETFANKYLAGGSVGLSNTVINLYRMPQTYGGMVSIGNDVFNLTYSSFTSATLNASTGEIRLSHPSLSDLNAKEKFNITVNAPYNVRPHLGSQGNDYITLYFYDSDGNVLKTFTSITFFASRIVNSTFVDATNVVDAGGNFWIYGVMEI